MPNVLKYVCCMVSMAVLAKAFRPFEHSLHQSSKTNASPSKGTAQFNDYHSNTNEKEQNIPKKFISTLGIHPIPTLRHKSQLGIGYLEKPFESAKSYPFKSELNKIIFLPYSEVSPRTVENIMHEKRTSSEPTKISTIEPKHAGHSKIREPSDYTVTYPKNPSRQNSPVSYHWRPYSDSGEKTEDNLYDKQLRDISHHLIRTPLQSSREDPIPPKYSHIHGRNPFVPSHINNLHFKPYLENQFSSQKQFKVNPEEHLRSNSAFDKHALSKSSYHSHPQISSRLRPFQSNMHSNSDNHHSHNSEYSGGTSSEEQRSRNQDNYPQSNQHLKSHHNDDRIIQMQKQSSPGVKGSVQYLRPSFHPSPLFENQHTRQLPIREESNFSERPQILSPHTEHENILTHLNAFVNGRASSPDIKPYQSPSQTDLYNSRDISHFVSDDSSKRSFPHFDIPTGKPQKSKPDPSNHFQLNVDRNNYPLIHQRSHDIPSLPDYLNLQPNLQESPHESESSQSQETMFFPMQTPEERDIKGGLPPMNLYHEPVDKHKEYTSDEEEDILAAQVKALLNPPANHSVESAQSQSELGKNLPPASNSFSVGNERNISPKHTATFDKDDAIVSLGSGPESESEEDSEDNKDAFSEEQHDGFLDMGAYTDKQGSFGWYADFPVGRGHDKVSYSSSK